MIFEGLEITHSLKFNNLPLYKCVHSVFNQLNGGVFYISLISTERIVHIVPKIIIFIEKTPSLIDFVFVFYYQYKKNLKMYNEFMYIHIVIITIFIFGGLES